MKFSQRYTVSDDSGYMGLFDPDGYVAFVSEEWTLQTLVKRFRREMAARHLLLWGTGMENMWTVHVQFGFSRRKGFREAIGPIFISKSRLCLTNYESLTMGAQFKDVALPEKHKLDLIIPAAAGQYQCRIVQLRDPEARDEPPENKEDFLVELEPVEAEIKPWATIPWGELGSY